MTLADRATRALESAQASDPDHIHREDNDAIRRACAQLADLGRYLTAGPEPTQLDDHIWDRNHKPGCPRAATD